MSVCFQDRRYHRWSQDSKRIHFGLASATSVSLVVKWPSGLVQTFPSWITAVIEALGDPADERQNFELVARAKKCANLPALTLLDH